MLYYCFSLRKKTSVLNIGKILIDTFSKKRVPRKGRILKGTLMAVVKCSVYHLAIWRIQ